MQQLRRLSLTLPTRIRQWRLAMYALCVASSMPSGALAQQDLPDSEESWAVARDGWMQQLRERTFAGWPKGDLPLEAKTVFEEIHNGVELRAIEFVSDDDTKLTLYITNFPGLRTPDLVVLNPLDEEGWEDFLATMRPGFEEELGGEDLPPADEEAFLQMKGMYRSFKWSMAYVAPRGIGEPELDAEQQKLVARELAGKGQTLDAMRVWDIRRAIQALRDEGDMPETQLWLQAGGRMAGNMLFASLFEPEVHRMDLYDPPNSLSEGPNLLGTEGVLDMPQVIAMALERSGLIVYEEERSDWSYVTGLAEKLKWDNSLSIRKPPSDE